jgi:hypothetical protein
MFFDPVISLIEIYPKKNVENFVSPNIFAVLLLIKGRNTGENCISIDERWNRPQSIN